MTERYYYNQLNKEQQKAYYAIREGLLQRKESFPVIRLSPEELRDIYFFVRLDDPEIFYSATYTYRYYEDASSVEMHPVYLFSKEKIREHQTAMQSRIRRIAEKAKDLTEKEKQLYIHDFILENVRYDKLKKEYSHEIIGALGNGVAVCEGIAKAVKVLCSQLGIWCIIAISQNNPEKGIRYRHAWNVLKIEGRYYHMDVTFDNTLSKEGVKRYDYTNLGDRQMFRDHEPVVWKIPECTDNDHFYYREKKLSWTTVEEVRKRTAQAVKKGRELIFHWRGGYLTKEVFQELTGVFSEEAEKKEKHAVCYVNWPQAIIRVRFEKGAGREEILLEEANEAENDSGENEICEGENINMESK